MRSWKAFSCGSDTYASHCHKHLAETLGLYHFAFAAWTHSGSMAFGHGLRLGREGSLRS